MSLEVFMLLLVKTGLAATLVVDSTGINSTYTTITDALAAASAGDTLEVLAGTYTEDLEITQDITIVGAGSGVTIINGTTIFQVEPGVTATISGLTLAPTTRAFSVDGATLTGSDLVVENVSASTNGIGLYASNGSIISLVDSYFSSLNTGAYNGGAIYVTDSTAVIEGCEFDSNASGSGGAIYASASDLTVHNSQFRGSTAAGYGGAIFSDSTLLISYSTFDTNAAYAGGGAVLSDGDLTVENSIFLANALTASTYGGAIWQASGNLIVTDSAFAGNQGWSGGAIRLDDGTTATITNGDFEDNVGSYGGAIRIATSLDITISDSTFLRNLVDIDGGAIRWSPSGSTSGTLTLTGSLFQGNESEDGGAVYLGSMTGIEISDCTFQENLASGAGGAVNISTSAQAEITRNQFCKNEAYYGGASYDVNVGVADTDGSHIWSNNLFVENIGTVGGAMYHGYNYAPLIWNNTFLGNSATTAGGGLYFYTDGFDFRNNILAYTSDKYGLYAYGAGAYAIDYNDFYNNNTSDLYGGVALGAGNIASDPLLSSYSMDGDCSNDMLWLGSGSPAHDAGDPSILDADGSTSEMGAYGGPDADTSVFTDEDGDGSMANLDCNDSDSSIYPGATEIPYDGIDQDCSGADACDQDLDGDNALLCGGGDCNDSNAAVSSTATEVWYDGMDADCSGGSDYDKDGDGEENAGFGGTDCDDEDPTHNSQTPEIWYDGVDQNCDGNDLDQDFDGHTSAGSGGDDCNELDPTIYAGASEVPYDGIDQDCDGLDLVDVDGDGFVGEAAGGDDCDDGVDSVFPGAPEVAGDGIDQDCDGADLEDASSGDDSGEGGDDSGAGGDDSGGKTADSCGGCTSTSGGSEAGLFMLLAIFGLRRNKH